MTPAREKGGRYIFSSSQTYCVNMVESYQKGKYSPAIVKSTIYRLLKQTIRLHIIGPTK